MRIEHRRGRRVQSEEDLSAMQPYWHCVQAHSAEMARDYARANG